jgi:hypothetical protein
MNHLMIVHNTDMENVVKLTTKRIRGLQQFIANIMKHFKYNVWRRIVSSGMLRRVVLVRTDVSDQFSASFIRLTRIGELGTTLAVTSN